MRKKGRPKSIQKQNKKVKVGQNMKNSGFLLILKENPLRPSIAESTTVKSGSHHSV